MSEVPVPEQWPGCLCPWGIRSLGRLYGVSMGKGVVRLSTNDQCPHHGPTMCQHYTKQWRAEYGEHPGRWAYCNVHKTKDCPS